MTESPNCSPLAVKIMIALIVVLYSSQDGGAQTRPMSAAEKWVADCVHAGRLAALEVDSQGVKQTLSGSFVRELLTGPQAKGYANGVRIKNANIVDLLDLSGLEIPCDLSLESCTFQTGLNCYLTHFKNNLFLDQSQFDGAVNLTYAEIANILIANGTQFNTDSTFNSMKVGRDASFVSALFKGRVDFGYSNIGGAFEADGAQFTADDQVSFINGKIGGSIYLGGAKFDGAVIFRFATIGGNFDADGISLNKVSPEITFNADGLVVTGHVFLRKALFKGNADFRRAHVGGDFEVSESEFEQPPNFQNVHVGDTAYFDRTRITGLALFEGMRYQFIGAGSNLKDLFDNHSKYNSDVYANLEDVFQRHGETDTAKYFHISGRERARSARWETPSFVGALNWVWDGLQDTVSGYGRHLERALYWSVLFMVFGWIVFRKEEWMETQNPQEAKRYEGRYRPLWYSIALFLPIVDLPDSKVWMPQRSHRFRRMYLRVHILLGYLLIPIGVAAWTGIIK